MASQDEDLCTQKPAPRPSKLDEFNGAADCASDAGARDSPVAGPSHVDAIPHPVACDPLEPRSPPWDTETPKWYWFTLGHWIYGNPHATLCRKLVRAPPTLTYHQLEAALLDPQGPPVNAPCHTASVLYSLVRTHTDAAYREFKAATGEEVVSGGGGSDDSGATGGGRGSGEIWARAEDGVGVQDLQDKVGAMETHMQTMMGMLVQLQGMPELVEHMHCVLLTMQSGPLPNPVRAHGDGPSAASETSSPRDKMF